MVAKVKVDTQRVGALPVISEFCNRLQLGHIVNTNVPWQGSPGRHRGNSGDQPLAGTQTDLSGRLLGHQGDFSEFLQNCRGKIT